MSSGGSSDVLDLLCEFPDLQLLPLYADVLSSGGALLRGGCFMTG